jgi:AcrR family transcriptional regulator
MTAARPKAEKHADTRERLLLTALQLYAREGLHAVSLRRISAEAGSKNSAAMHYHFDNQRGVLHALMKMITYELRDVAEALRDDKGEEKGEQRSLRQACRDIVRPLVLLPSKQPWGADAVHFLSRVVSENDPDLPAIINDTYAPFLQQLDKAVAAELPDLPAPVRRLRLMFIHTNIFHGVAEVAWLTHTPLGNLSNFDQETLLGHLVDFLIGGLEAPSHAGQ